MKKKKQTNGDKPVTLAQFNKRAIQVNHKFDKMDRRFDEMDRRFDIMETRFEMNDRRFIGLNARVETLEKKVDALDKKFQDSFAELYNYIGQSTRELGEKFDDFITKMYELTDASLKRSEENEREILCLGKQHDDLANYCTKKIAYPPYGGGGIATKSVESSA